MNSQILKCSNNNLKYFETYRIDSKFYVYKSCITLDHWSRGIKKKTTVAELENGFERPSSSTRDMINND